MDEELQESMPSRGDQEKKRKKKRELELPEEFKGKMTPDELEASHRQFMSVMFGLFAIALILMIVFNSNLDFALDGM
jgi:hypothetical protein